MEARAYRAYRNNEYADSDLETEEDREIIDEEKEYRKTFGEKLYDIYNTPIFAKAEIQDDLEFEGGSKSGSRKKKNQNSDKGCFGKLVNLGGGNNTSKKHGGPEKEWSEMTEE